MSPLVITVPMKERAYEGEGIVGYLPKATSFMPDAGELSGTDLDASQDSERQLTV